MKNQHGRQKRHGRSVRSPGNQPLGRTIRPGGLPLAKARTFQPGGEQTQSSPGALSPQQVLDLHADMHRILASPTPLMKRIMATYAREDASVASWAASHLHPATSTRDLEPWIASLGRDLFGATTYQVTAEMIDLATALQETTPDLSDIVAEDLPSEAGFMWLDKPIPRPSVEDQPGQEPLMMHAVSWQMVDNVPIRLGPPGPGSEPETDDERERLAEHTTKVKIELRAQQGEDGIVTAYVPGIRVREWGWNDSPGVQPRPLHLMGQNTTVLSKHVHTPLPEMRLVHMLWILMGMEITSSRPEGPRGGRQGRKRSANLKRAEVRVITLRRPTHGETKPSATPRHIDWKCSWLVRGHWRQAPHGGTFSDGRERTWIRPYIKGPDGLPLNSADILYKLAR